jgi:tripartite-type tricarboxylate transporter receptor subunit TctC
LFFKWIKQHLRIKAFFGTNENTVKTQIWIAISVYVLVAIVKKRLAASVQRTLVVNQSFPAKTVPEFITYVKANPGKLNIAMPGGMNDISGELFKIMAGVDMTNVPYRGGAPALTDLLGGQVHVIFIGPGATEYISTGKLRALAVTTATRSELLPDIPTVGDFLPGFEASVWWGVGAPKNTPMEIVDKLNKEINAGLADTKIKARLADMGATPLAGSSADFGKLIADETEKWGKVIRAAGIKAE